MEESSLVVDMDMPSDTPSEPLMLSTPKNLVMDLFTNMVLRLQDEYAISPEHGLDKYLSVRIRHGALTAQLRNPVDDAYLLSPRAVGSSEYKLNEYWSELLRHADPATRNAVSRRLSKFSREFDSYIKDVLSWVRVRRDGQEGMFEFEFTTQELVTLSKLVTGGMSCREFIDVVLIELNGRLDGNLSRVRERLAHEAKSRASALLDSLAADIERIGRKSGMGPLVNAARAAKTDLLVAIDRVTAWFVRSRAGEDEPFELGDAVDIAVEMVRTFSPGFRADVLPEDASRLLVDGRWLSSFVDVFFLLFENIVRHSGIVFAPAAEVYLPAKAGSLEIVVENQVAPESVTPKVVERLARIREELERGHHDLSVSREGGTGLHKLAKILAHDFAIDSAVTFHHVSGDRFRVAFAVPLALGKAGAEWCLTLVRICP